MAENTMTGEIRLRVPAGLLARLTARAKLERRELPDFIRLVLDDAAPPDGVGNLRDAVAIYRSAPAFTSITTTATKSPALPGGKTRKIGRGLAVPVQPAKPAKKAKRENLFEAI